MPAVACNGCCFTYDMRDHYGAGGLMGAAYGGIAAIDNRITLALWQSQ
jgi:hypothetical protein